MYIPYFFAFFVVPHTSNTVEGLLVKKACGKLGHQYKELQATDGTYLLCDCCGEITKGTVTP
jgi:hypothetical protein